jgi:GNAT superfamily N-acetyltransferase
MTSAMDEFVMLQPGDCQPAVAAGGVRPLADEDRRAHRPDAHLMMIRNGTLAARCSCWWRGTPTIDRRRTGIIGHYAAADPTSGPTVLARACEVLADAGCDIAVGPMDGSPWRSYRLILERGAEPAFFLEPDTPPEWVAHWTSARFETLATYSSAVTGGLDEEDPRTPGTLVAMRQRGIRFRAFDPARADADIRAIYALASVAFRDNFLFAPISEQEFLAMHRRLLPLLRRELIVLAEQDDGLVGFLMGVPDARQAQRGPVDTVILKSLAVHPALRGQGTGAVLVDLVQQAARRLGYRRAIHALMHDGNPSRRLSHRYARTFRRYALFGRDLRCRPACEPGS